MSKSSDSDVLIALAELEAMINRGIAKVDGLLQEAWDNQDLKQIQQEISQARQELEKAGIVLEENQNRSTLTLQELHALEDSASKQKDLLERTHQVSINLYSDLKSEAEKGRDCLNSLVVSIKESEQYKTQFHEAIQRIEVAENILAEIDRKYDFLLEVWDNLTEIKNSIGGYDSLKDLVTSIREATEKLQEKQDLAQNAIDAQIKPLKYQIDLLNNSITSIREANQRLQSEQRLTQMKIDAQIEPLKRQLDRLIQAQCTPWWLPSNWWWKKRISFTAKPFRQLKK